jgi:translation initiation factor 4E
MRWHVKENMLNTIGGNRIARLRNVIADRIWEDFVLVVVGDQFDGCVTR